MLDAAVSTAMVDALHETREPNASLETFTGSAITSPACLAAPVLTAAAFTGRLAGCGGTGGAV